MHPDTPTPTFDQPSGDGAPLPKRSSEEEDGWFPLDDTDLRAVLWHVRSALEDAECIAGRPILKMGIERDLQRAERILSDHAQRNGLDV
jgi:hypothetical protein